MRIRGSLVLLVGIVSAVDSSGWNPDSAFSFAPAVSLHVSPTVSYMDFNSLARIDALSAARVESLKGAEEYVRRCANISGVGDSALMFGGIESRLAAGELAAAKEGRLVSDDQVAEAFNLLSAEFRVVHPARLTAPDILQYRSAMSAIFPHVFSAKTRDGSRPVGAVAMLYLLVYNGGITEGVRNFAQTDPAPGSLKFGHARSQLVPTSPSRAEREYQTASQSYFLDQPAEGVRALIERLAATLALPGLR